MKPYENIYEDQDLLDVNVETIQQDIEDQSGDRGIDAETLKTVLDLKVSYHEQSDLLANITAEQEENKKDIEAAKKKLAEIKNLTAPLFELSKEHFKIKSEVESQEKRLQDAFQHHKDANTAYESYAETYRSQKKIVRDLEKRLEKRKSTIFEKNQRLKEIYQDIDQKEKIVQDSSQLLTASSGVAMNKKTWQAFTALKKSVEEESIKAEQKLEKLNKERKAREKQLLEDDSVYQKILFELNNEKKSLGFKDKTHSDLQERLTSEAGLVAILQKQFDKAKNAYSISLEQQILPAWDYQKLSFNTEQNQMQTLMRSLASTRKIWERFNQDIDDVASNDIESLEVSFELAVKEKRTKQASEPDDVIAEKNRLTTAPYKSRPSGYRTSKERHIRKTEAARERLEK